MALLTHGLETIETGATGWVTILNAMIAALDPNRITSGLLSARPAASKAQRFYYATDIQVLFYDNGSAWAVAAAGLQSKTPASAGATGTMGERAVDANYLYECVATNTWIRFTRAW
ncbi:MAG TPA: hypothetical protein VLH56_06180 [Dissulfurispiraceae bacterium]|nr:hypothetical protein [Dissulfurispiraceae bacterium]